MSLKGKRNFSIVLGGIFILFGVTGYISVRLALRDATGTADIIIKILGSFGALLFATLGPLGLIGFSVMMRTESKTKFIIALLSSLLISILLILYIFNRLRIYSLFN